MDTTTTAAAAQAKVTVATIRTWCRTGAVAATKNSGRWVVDAGSLRRRIRLGRTMRLAGAQRRAAVSRDRILAMLALQLPALTGTTAQIDWARGLRRDRIARALTVAVDRTGHLTYRLRGQWDDPLGVTYIPGLTGVYDTETQALNALLTAATCGRRTTAAWWIDNRDQHAPMD